MRILLCLVTALFAVSAHAASPHYSFISANYAASSIDDPDIDADGFGLDASFDFAAGFFGIASYGAAETDDFGGATIKSTDAIVGLGYHHALTPSVDLVPALSFVRNEIEGTGGLGGLVDDDDTGFMASLALVGMATPALELRGGVNHVDIYEDADQVFFAQGTYFFAPMFGVQAGYAVADDVNTWTVGARLNFR